MAEIKRVRYLAAGDRTLVVEFGEEISREINLKMRQFSCLLEERKIPGIEEIVPTYRSVAIYYDPLKIDFSILKEELIRLEEESVTIELPEPKLVKIPTLYGGDYGPDLDYVASSLGLTPEEVISLHTGKTYTVYTLGFSPGWAYIGDLPKELVIPRRKTPRTLVPAGSVAIAMNQTGIYPVESPGGWQLIGRTPILVYDPERLDPFLLNPGDNVQFIKITEGEYLRIKEKITREKKEGERCKMRVGEGEYFLEVLEPGLLTTIQDLGRGGFMRYGVPPSGAMDDYAFRIGNILLGNEESAAGLEITLLGPKIKFLMDGVIALTGADLTPLLDGEPIPLWEVILVKRGQILSFGGVSSGCRAYLLVAGGIDLPPVLGSRSTYTRGKLGGVEGRPLNKGDLLKVEKKRMDPSQLLGRKFPSDEIPRYYNEVKLKVIMGPQDDYFSKEGIHTFFNSLYSITKEADRMGYRLSGPPLKHSKGVEIASDASPLGAIQVPADGFPIILLKDRGTLGGYPKITTVISSDISSIAQLKPGDRVRFEEIPLEEAHRLLREREAKIRGWKESLAIRKLVSAYRLSVTGRIHLVEIEELPSKEIAKIETLKKGFGEEEMRIAAKRIRVTDTTLRDAHQSLLATRMRTEDMVPIAEKIDNVGYHSLEVWGGATFDTSLRYLKEDPWERLRTLRKCFRKTKLQMLLRGQNLVGYRHYPDDVVEAFLKRVLANGLDIIRIFDALNDVRNMEKAIKVAKKEGAHVQGAICYTISPVHDIEHYLSIARSLKDLEVDSICLKDMAGLLSPQVAFELISRFKKELDIPIQLHCHYTSGLASMSYLKAIEAGVDIVDTAISSVALGTSQPAIEPLVVALSGTPYNPGFDLDLLSEIADYFREIRKKYKLELDLLTVDTNVLSYQIPGGMISNLVSQLKAQGAMDKYPEVLKEVPRVRRDLGYPPLVTPSSQIVGTQATLNVLLGERYKVVTKEVKDYVKGLYGRPPAPIAEEIKRLIIGDEEVITCRPADLLEPQLEKAREEIKEYIKKEEDVITYALFPQVALQFFKERKNF